MHLFFIQSFKFTFGTYGCLFQDAYIRLYTENRYESRKEFYTEQTSQLILGLINKRLTPSRES